MMMKIIFEGNLKFNINNDGIIQKQQKQQNIFENYNNYNVAF